MPPYLTFALISTNMKNISRDPLPLDCGKKGHQFKIDSDVIIASDVPL